MKKITQITKGPADRCFRRFRCAGDKTVEMDGYKRPVQYRFADGTTLITEEFSKYTDQHQIYTETNQHLLDAIGKGEAFLTNDGAIVIGQESAESWEKARSCSEDKPFQKL